MDKIKSVLKKQFCVDCIDIIEVHGGLSAINYKVKTIGQTFFLKVYDKKKAQSLLWTENIDYYMPILVWLNENTKLHGRIIRPLKTNDGACLHSYDNEIPINTDRMKEDFSVPCLTQLVEKNNEVKLLSEKMKQKDMKMVLCHTGYNFMQSERLVLVDWEGIKQCFLKKSIGMFLLSII